MRHALIARWRHLYEAYSVLFYLSIVAMLAELAYGIVNQSALPPYVQELGLTAQIGIIYATFLAIETLFKSPMGSIGDRIGRRPLVVGGALLSCLVSLGITVFHSLWQLLILRALDGIAAAAIWPTMVAAIGGSVSPERRTTAMSALTVTYIAGVAFGPLLGGIANDLTNSRLTSFYVVSIIFFVTAIVAALLTPHRSKEEEEEAYVVEESSSRWSCIVMGLKAVPHMMLLAFGVFFAVGLLIPIIKLFAMNQLHMSETGFGALIFPVAGAVGVASLGSGKLGDAWGKTRSVRLGVGMGALAMWAIASVDTPWELLIAGAFLGIGFVLAMPAWLALVSDIAAPHLRGAVIGALGTAQGIGAVLGAAVGPYLYQSVPINFFGIHKDSHYTPFVASALALTACFILVMLTMREGRHRRIIGKA